MAHYLLDNKQNQKVPKGYYKNLPGTETQRKNKVKVQVKIKIFLSLPLPLPALYSAPLR